MTDEIQRELGGIEAKLENIESMMSSFVSKCNVLDRDQRKTASKLSVLETQISTATKIFVVFGPVVGGIVATVMTKVFEYFSRL